MTPEQQVITNLVTQQLADHNESAFYYSGQVHTIFINSSNQYEYSYGEFNDIIDDGGVFGGTLTELLTELF